MGQKTTGLVTICTLWLYALVTNLPPSVIRASTMGSLILMGKMGEREGDAFNSLGVAGWGMLIFRPRDLFDPGFQLSFVATGGILGFYPPIRNWFPDRGQVWGKWVFAPLAVSLAAQVTTTPLVVIYFGQISLVGLAANLVVVPLMGVAVSLGLLTVVAFVVFAPFATVFNGANWAVLKLGIWVAEWMAQPGWAAVWVARPHWTVWGMYGCVLLLILPHVWASRLGNRVVLFLFVLANM